MKNSLLRYTCTVMTACILSACHTSQTIASVPQKPDVTDKQTRINPHLGHPSPKPVSITDYAFLNNSANHIELNGADWHSVIDKFTHLGQPNAQNVTIVHIGDSHIQADGNTGRVRLNLQKEYGNAGRGLMTPLRIAGTNQPIDYSMALSGGASTATLLKTPWHVKMGFTGVAVKPSASNAIFKISDKTPFNRLIVYANEPVKIQTVTAEGNPLQYTAAQTDNGAVINLAKHTTAASVTISGNQAVVYGFDARDTDTPGVLYHAIGNNGAAYTSYTKIDNFGHELATLTPDVVVVSLGSNEAFGNVSDATFYSEIDALVKEIRSGSPNALIMLTTPSECQRSVYTKAYTTKGKGKKKRRTTTTKRSYQTNANIERLRNVILRYGKENNIATYDFYAVAGGKGASGHWLQHGLLSSDRIHRTWNGYYLEGNLFYNALSALLGADVPIVCVTDNNVQAESESVESAPKTLAPAKKAVVSKPTAKSKKKTSAKKKPRKKKKRK